MNKLYEWDPNKATSNYAKHGIRFADATTVFMDDLSITVANESDDEERYITIGVDASWRILIVVFTWRDDAIRLISARRATSSEQEQYLGQ